MSHTPGPWKWEDGYIMDSQRVPYPVASVNAMGSIAESEANARLIAQAPEMLEFCKRVAYRYQVFCNGLVSPEVYADYREAINLINKATGHRRPANDQATQSRSHSESDRASAGGIQTRNAKR